MNKLFKTVDKFFNPKKYYDDRITKPIKQLQRGDMVYILYLPKEGKPKEYKEITYKNFSHIIENIILYHGRVVNLTDCVKETKICLDVAVEECRNDYISLAIDDFKICKKNIIPTTSWSGVYYISTNKKSLIEELNLFNAWVELNFKAWKEKCHELETTRSNYWFSQSPTKTLMQDIKKYKRKLSNVKYEIKLL